MSQTDIPDGGNSGDGDAMNGGNGGNNGNNSGGNGGDNSGNGGGTSGNGGGGTGQSGGGGGGETGGGSGGEEGGGDGRNGGDNGNGNGNAAESSLLNLTLQLTGNEQDTGNSLHLTAGDAGNNSLISLDIHADEGDGNGSNGNGGGGGPGNCGDGLLPLDLHSGDDAHGTGNGLHLGIGEANCGLVSLDTDAGNGHQDAGALVHVDVKSGDGGGLLGPLDPGGDHGNHILGNLLTSNGVFGTPGGEDCSSQNPGENNAGILQAVDDLLTHGNPGDNASNGSLTGILASDPDNGNNLAVSLGSDHGCGGQGDLDLGLVRVDTTPDSGLADGLSTNQLLNL